MGVNSEFKALSCLLAIMTLSVLAYSSYFYHQESVIFLARSIFVKGRDGIAQGYYNLDYNLEALPPENRTSYRLKTETSGRIEAGSLPAVETIQVPPPRRLENQPTQSDSHRMDTRIETNSNISSSTKKQYSGYIVALKIYEQQTMATGNLFQLQCFASKLNLSVIIPLMKDSSFLTPLDESVHPYMLELKTTYSMQEWEKSTARAGYAPLVRWEEFIKYAPREVVLVQIKYPTLTLLKQIRSGSLPHNTSESREYEKGCGYKHIDRDFTALKKKNFSVVRRVCYNYLSRDDIPLEVFRQDLLRKEQTSSKNVTIIIDEWRGLGENQRVRLKEDNICTDESDFREKLQVSPKVLQDAEIYRNRYLGTAKYIAVIARYEMTGLTRKTSNKNDTYAIVPHCLQETLNKLEILRKETKTAQTFLSMDIGKYGSKSFIKKDYFGHLKDMEAFVSKVYKGKMDISHWERTFEDITDVRDSGYISMLQQVIVTKAKCILFVGGGTFQEHTLHLYKQMHPNISDRCISIVKKCTSASRPL